MIRNIQQSLRPTSALSCWGGQSNAMEMNCMMSHKNCFPTFSKFQSILLILMDWKVDLGINKTQESCLLAKTPQSYTHTHIQVPIVFGSQLF